MAILGVLLSVAIGMTAAGVTYTITAWSGNKGTISPSGEVLVAEGANQTFTIIVNAGYQIAGVFVDGVYAGMTPSYTFESVTENHAIEVYYALDQEGKFAIRPFWTENGWINPPAVAYVAQGGQFTFTMNSDPGCRVVNVRVDGATVGAVASYTFYDVEADHIIEADFGPDTFTITATAEEGGTIDPNGAIDVARGADQTFVITARPDYYLTDVLVDERSVGAVRSHTFASVEADHSITALFAPVETWITTIVEPSEGATVSPEAGTMVPYGVGGTLAFNFLPSPGWSFETIEVLRGGYSLPDLMWYAYGPGERNLLWDFGAGVYEIRVHLRSGTWYPIQTYAEGPGIVERSPNRAENSIALDNAGFYEVGTYVTFIAKPEPGCVFSQWGRDAFSTEEEFSFTVVDAWSWVDYRAFFTDVTPPQVRFIGVPEMSSSDTTPAITWEGTDNITRPENLVYTTMLDGVPLSGPSEATSAELGPLAAGAHCLLVDARDEECSCVGEAQYLWFIDLEPPHAAIVRETAPLPNSDDPTPTLSWSGYDNHTQLDGLLFSTRLDNEDWSAPSPTFSRILGPLCTGQHSFEVRAVDEAGNVGSPDSYAWQVCIDTTPPEDPTVTSADHDVGVWSNDRNVTIDVAGAADAESGVDGYEVAWDQSAAWAPSHTKSYEETWTGDVFIATADGAWYLHLATVDNAGNWTETVRLGPFNIDTTQPELVGCPGDTTWYAAPGLTAASVYWTPPTVTDNLDLSPSLGGSAAPGDEFPLGDTVVTYEASDHAGNTTSCSFAVLVLEQPAPPGSGKELVAEFSGTAYTATEVALIANAASQVIADGAPSGITLSLVRDLIRAGTPADRFVEALERFAQLIAAGASPGAAKKEVLGNKGK
jgi:hypothetical protein